MTSPLRNIRYNQKEIIGRLGLIKNNWVHRLLLNQTQAVPIKFDEYWLMEMLLYDTSFAFGDISMATNILALYVIRFSVNTISKDIEKGGWTCSWFPAQLLTAHMCV